MLIQQGIRDAEVVGNDIFDFGGSADKGVDRFYAEFGAYAEPRFRTILVKGWARPWLVCVPSGFILMSSTKSADDRNRTGVMERFCVAHVVGVENDVVRPFCDFRAGPPPFSRLARSE